MKLSGHSGHHRVFFKVPLVQILLASKIRTRTLSQYGFHFMLRALLQFATGDTSSVDLSTPPRKTGCRNLRHPVTFRVNRPRYRRARFCYWFGHIRVWQPTTPIEIPGQLADPLATVVPWYTALAVTDAVPELMAWRLVLATMLTSRLE